MPDCILTARPDEQSQQFFNLMRERYFPRERNFLKAHLTLFHKIPDNAVTLAILRSLRQHKMQVEVSSLKTLGNGVAYFLNAPELEQLHRSLQFRFHAVLHAQDRMPIRPHITIQNKVDAVHAGILLQELSATFEPFKMVIEGVDLWHYLGGPWAHYHFFPFNNPER